MIRQGDIITLDKEDFEGLLDRECKQRLGMTGKEYLKKRKNGGLLNLKPTAVRDIEMLLRLA